MAVLSIKLYGSEDLRKKAIPVDVSHFKEVCSLVENMVDTVKYNKAKGLAANQVGRTEAIFVVRCQDNAILTCINPSIIDQYDEFSFKEEACLSLPGCNAITKRYNYIQLKWLDLEQQEHEAIFSGIDAVAVQHEMEHLNGQLYLDQFGPVKKQMLITKYKKFLARSAK